MSTISPSVSAIKLSTGDAFECVSSGSVAASCTRRSEWQVLWASEALWSEAERRQRILTAASIRALVA